jgi:hypothetical protein
LLGPAAKLCANLIDQAGSILILVQAQALTILTDAGQEAEFLQAQITLLQQREL